MSARTEEHKKNIIRLILDACADIFKPLSPAVTAAGIIKATLTVLVLFVEMPSENAIFRLAELIAEAPLYFLPVLLAYSCAEYFGCNIPCALALGGLLVHPDLFDLLHLLDGSQDSDYSFSVFPIIISVMLMSAAESLTDRIRNNALRYFVKPALSVGVTGAFALCVLGPLGLMLSDCISILLENINEVLPWLSPTLVGAFYPILMLGGAHFSLVPLGINNIVVSGSDRFVGPGMLVSNIAQSGAALAYSLTSRRISERRSARSSAFSALFGIVEPAMYGVNIKNRGTLAVISAAGGAAGFFMGISGVERFTTATPGIIALTGYIGETGYGNLTNTLFAVIAAFTFSFLGTIFLSTDITNTAGGEQMGIFKRNKKKITVYSPLSGQAVRLSEVNDPTFSEGILGDGVAVVPDVGELYSPADGVIESVADTFHAIAIGGDSGVQILMHIGIDTVELGGAPFSVKVNVGDRVKRGQLLVEFDVEEIKARGYDTVTPIVITNSDEFTSVEAHLGDVRVSEAIIELSE